MFRWSFTLFKTPSRFLKSPVSFDTDPRNLQICHESRQLFNYMSGARVLDVKSIHTLACPAYIPFFRVPLDSTHPYLTYDKFALV